MTKYYLFIGPLNHLASFVKNGYVQQNANHKKRLEKLKTGDYFAFYASRMEDTGTAP